MLSIDEIIELCIGSLSRYQLSVCLAAFLTNFPLAWQEMAILFIDPKIAFSCSNATIDKCSKDCPKVVFDDSVFTWTIRTQWNLICDAEHWPETSQTILMAGVLSGNFCFGFLGDKFGRRLPILIGVIFQLITGIAISFVPWFWAFLILRYLVALFCGGVQITSFCIVVEVVGKEYRSALGVLFQLFYYMGYSSLGIFGYFLRDWRYFQLAVSLSAAPLLLYYWILPESTRWLLTEKRFDKAIKQLEWAAKFNRMPTEHIRNTVVANSDIEEKAHGRPIDLLLYPNIRKKLLIVCVSWAWMGLTYFGTAQLMGHLSGNIFWNVFICGAVQLPGNIFIIPMMRYFGRKITSIAMLIVTSLGCFLILAMPDDPFWAKTVCACFAITGISLAFATHFVWGGELYPTIVRNAAMGFSSMSAKFGSMVAPHIASISDKIWWLPPVAFGIGPIVDIFLCFFLPETNNTKLPDTLEEAEAFGKKEPAT